MAYTIRNSDGTVLTVLPDGEIDQVTTSLTLIGRNFSSYGEYVNQNLVEVLQNFASTGVSPRSPLVGQLWYNRADDRLYVYSINNIFRPVGAAQVSPSEPTIPEIGDLWIDSTNRQLYFTSDGIDFTLVGPTLASTSTAAIKNGWYETTVTNTASQVVAVAALYNNDKVVAVASSSTFTLGTALDGITSVETGIKLNNSISGIRFVGTATSANDVNAFSGVYLEVAPVGGSQATTASLQVLNSNGILIGPNTSQIQLRTTSTATYIDNVTSNLPLIIQINQGGDVTALKIDPVDKKTSFYPDLAATSSTVAVSGDLSIGRDIMFSDGTTQRTSGTQVSQNNISTASYALVLADKGRQLYFVSTCTVLVPTHASIPYSTGTVISFVNDSTNDVTISSVNTSTRIIGAGIADAASWILGARGMSSIVKVANNRWYLSGYPLTEN